MPGVPPDALAQVKKGLKGLFGRKKRERDSAAQSHSASSSSTNKPPAAAAPAAGLVAARKEPEIQPVESHDTTTPVEAPSTSGEPPGTTAAAEESGPPTLPETQKSQPITLEQAKAVELHPAPTDAPSGTAIHSATSQTAPGMSATSGPLDDAREFAHGDEEDVAIQQGNTVKEVGGEELLTDKFKEQS